MINYICPMCNEAHGEILTDLGYLCKPCFYTEYSRCEVCNNFVHAKDLVLSENNQHICMNCFNSNYVICKNCNKIIHIGSLQYLLMEHDEENNPICSNCFNEYYKKCDACGKYAQTKNIIYLNNDKYTKICKTCAKALPVTKCQKCYNLFIKTDNDDSDICLSCNILSQNVKNYSYKPAPAFKSFKKKDERLWMGVEIEFQNDNIDKYDKIISNKKSYYVKPLSKSSFLIKNSDCSNLFYQKYDGSVSNGIEMVSHPLTLNYWHQNSDKISELFVELIKNNCRSQAAKSCGMHVHITRAINSEQLALLVYFVNKYKKNVEKIAGRTSNHYSQYHNVPRYEDISSMHDIMMCTRPNSRYDAINVRNDKTIEYRIFQSVLDPFSFYKNIEFVHSTFKYAQTLSWRDAVSKSCWYRYVNNFLKDNPDYTFIYNFIANDFKF